MACMMTLDELLAMRSAWWIRAVQEGKIALIRMVIRELGKCEELPAGGKHYVVRHGDLTLSCPAIGREFNVQFRNRLVAGEWEDFSLYVPGPWEKTMQELTEAARAVQVERLSKSMEQDRQRLIHELWLDEPMDQPQPSRNGKESRP
jgi:hypothetical protein